MERRRIVRQASFPQVSLPSVSGGRGTEVALIAQLDPGAGDSVATRAGQRQRQHPAYSNALDEPSALLSAPDFDNDDPASLHSFSVGQRGHPFHRHSGSRLFTAISGSGGALLRFSTATSVQISADPGSFMRNLQQVEVPADCLFTVRMERNVWHQFLPLQHDGKHPALFALSCHPDESAGTESAAIRDHVHHGQASIADLTELLPAHVLQPLQQHTDSAHHPANIRLGFGNHPRSHCAQLWARLRRCVGSLRQRVIGYRATTGFVSRPVANPRVQSVKTLSPDSLLHTHLDAHHHQDSARIVLPEHPLATTTAPVLLAQLLQAFLDQPPATISGLMRLRNRLVKPWGLRTSSLGCPVSSLLSETSSQYFSDRFPVLAQRSESTFAQVVLGADDRHLQFRSCISVRRDGTSVEITLSTRVRCRNRFGHFYMALVEPVHRHYIAPTMLGAAVSRLLEHRVQASPHHTVAFAQIG